ncbi:NitT/TauT family transport system substrate-binding protein [Herbihabitans rhizosphaerae]|uniref:NitT/TauT family transport system substrate-binding protein n=1 Tax=Herbihabitans rhizosphaerae TaxID=1872711 RepID=A0A4Q7KVL8_9PSEU|nr:ABC transporter substrate-binding protein [Herbihabitans rhizosphaerae]RZS41069.1 NitT/TauT family transport system substrate-binding protein [Herbihabitans rhizosphaerae]
MSRRGTATIIGLVFPLLAALTGCSALGDSESSASAGGKVEKSSIKISVMPTTDVAPFHLAMKRGYFKAEGIDDVKISNAPSGGASVTKLTSGEVDIAYSSYTPFYVAKAKGVLDLKFVADASSAGPKSTVVVALPTSSVRTPADLAGKRVAVTARNTISDLLTMATLKIQDVPYQTIKWVEIPFPQTAAKLASREVDAAFLTEPWITHAAKTTGAVPVIDVATGPTANFPTAGYASTGKFTSENPKTVAAFQRAMKRATDESRDRSVVEPLLVEFAGVDHDIAKLATLLDFQSAMDATRMQRVPDLLLEFKVIDKKIDVAPLLVK